MYVKKYKQDGYAGFGDFTILEEGYDVPSGAQADKVTHVIHFYLYILETLKRKAS